MVKIAGHEVTTVSESDVHTQDGWQLQRRRGEVMEALDASIRHLLSLEAPLNAWAAHSAQAEAALVSAAGMSLPKPPKPLLLTAGTCAETITLQWQGVSLSAAPFTLLLLC